MRRRLVWVGVAGATVTATTVLSAGPAAALSCPAWSPTCQAVGDVVGGVLGPVAGGVADSVADTVLGTLASGFLEAYLLMFRWATTWWLSFTMSPAALAGTVDSSLTGLIAYLAGFVLVVALLSAAITTIWRRDGAVLADTAAGVFKALVVIAAGWAGLGVLWKLADQLTAAVAPSSANITIDPALGQAVLAGGPGIAVLVLLLSAIGFVLSLGMALMMVFRVASVVVLGLMLPIAAAGSPGTTTRGWLPKVLGWLLALIFLRPMVAAIYRIGFEFTAGGNDGSDAVVAALNGTGRSLPASAADGLLTLVVGMMTLLVAMLALPVLLKLFAWMFGGGPAGGGGAGLALASLGANGAILARGLHPGGTALGDEPTGAASTGGGGSSGGPAGHGPSTSPGSTGGPIAGAGGSAASSAPTASGGAAAGAGAGGTAGGAGAAAAAGGPAVMAAAAGVMAVGAAAGQARQAVVTAAQGPEDQEGSP